VKENILRHYNTTYDSRKLPVLRDIRDETISYKAPIVRALKKIEVTTNAKHENK